MESDMTHRLRQLQQRAERLGRVANDLAAAAPSRAEGSDPTGCVQVSVGSDSLPTDIRVRDRWQERLEAESLAEAVLDAYTDALRTKQRLWARQLDETGWWRQRHVEGIRPAGAPLPAPAGGRPRDGDPEFGEQILKAAQNARQQATQDPVQTAQGSDPGRHVTVRLGPGGLTTCDINPRWASNSSGTTLSSALTTALRRAKHDLASLPGSTGELDDLLRDSLATLSEVARNQPRRGDR
jgi:DNA-binding protein YbaB